MQAYRGALDEMREDKQLLSPFAAWTLEQLQVLTANSPPLLPLPAR